MHRTDTFNGRARHVAMATALVGAAALVALSQGAEARAGGPSAQASSYLGVDIPLSAAPWMVTLAPLDEHKRPKPPSKPGSYNPLICSGAVIGPRLVLTASHCVTDDLSRVGVRVGSGDLFKEPGRVVGIARVWSPQLHDRYALRKDLALVETTEPLDMPILPIASEPPAVGETVSSIGFGSPAADPNVQKRPLLRRFDSVVVECKYEDATCTRATNGGGARNGDSGGPLTIVRGGVTQLAGIAVVVDVKKTLNFYAGLVSMRALVDAPQDSARVPVPVAPARIVGAKAGGTARCEGSFAPKPQLVKYRIWIGGLKGKKSYYRDAKGKRHAIFDLRKPDSTTPTVKLPRDAGGKELICLLTARSGPEFVLDRTVTVKVKKR